MAEKLLIVGISATVFVALLLISAVRSIWLIGKDQGSGSLSVSELIEEERRAQSE